MSEQEQEKNQAAAREQMALLLRVRDIAGQHLSEMFKQYSNPAFRWVKADFTQPAFEHFAFGYKGSVFAVLIDIWQDGHSTLPEPMKAALCQQCVKYQLIPCLFRVESRLNQGNEPNLPENARGKPSMTFLVKRGKWNLFDAQTGDELDPTLMAVDGQVRLSDWEMMTMLISAVRTALSRQEGTKVLSYCDLPGVSPQLWFQDKTGRRSWVLVRGGMVPDPVAAFRELIAKTPALQKHDGYFAPVLAVSSAFVETDAHGQMIGIKPGFDGKQPLWRGENVFLSFQQLTKIHTAQAQA